MAHSQPIIRSGVLTEFKSYLTDRGIDYEALARFTELNYRVARTLAP